MPSVPRLKLLLLLIFSSLHQSIALPAQIDDASSVSEAQGALKFISGPVITGGFADPSVLKVGNTYYTYATNENGVRCPAARSSNFKDWTPVANNRVLPELPAWAADGKGESVWGPDVTQISDNQYVLYTTAVTKENYDHRCIGAATSNNPLGPFKSASKPLLCPPKSGNIITNVIGGAGFHDPSSPAGQTRYILYGERVLTPGQIAKTRTMAQPVSADGLKAIGDAFPMTVADASEGFVNESPSVIYADNTFVVFFSTHAWDGGEWAWEDCEEFVDGGVCG
ncbi:MAG: hypothetical protein Q9221_004853 [Calogaya cf. arnoldii]